MSLCTECNADNTGFHYSTHASSLIPHRIGFELQGFSWVESEQPRIQPRAIHTTRDEVTRRLRKPANGKCTTTQRVTTRDKGQRNGNTWSCHPQTLTSSIPKPTTVAEGISKQ